MPLKLFVFDLFLSRWHPAPDLLGFLRVWVIHLAAEPVGLKKHRIDAATHVPLSVVIVHLFYWARSIVPSLLAVAGHLEPPLGHAARGCCWWAEFCCKKDHHRQIEPG